MNARNYPPERIERYVTALNDADAYAQLSTPADRERLARAVMAVADAETDPVYKSGYDTGVMHAGAGRIAAERDCLAMAVQFAIQWRPDAPMGLREGIEEILATLPLAGEKSSREADATPETAPYTDSETAFMQIGTAHWPRRAVLFLEGLPPLVGTYNGAGMRRLDHHDGVLIEPMLAFADAPTTPGEDGRS
jgi:hypothetical protein